MMNRARVSAAFSIALLAAAPGCGSSQASDGAPASSDPTTAGGSTATAQRAISEADIIQLDSGRLYAMSASSGSVSIVDVSKPGQLTLLGQTALAGEPFEMYRRGDLLVTMWNGAFAVDGSPVPVGKTTTTSGTYYQPPRDPSSGAAVIVLDVHDPQHIQTVATFPVAGEVADSRIVGDILYLATYENAQCYRCAALPRTLVTTFNLQDPTAMRQVAQASFSSNAPDSYNFPWGSNWKRSIFVTDQRLYIGGHADIDPSQLSYSTTGSSIKEGIIDVLDITDPTGRLLPGARINVAGAILSRWQLDERNGVLRVVSQRGAGRTGNGVAMPEVDTFTIASTQQYTPLGHTTLQLPRQEGLRTVRFDQDRAYAITYNQTDPLFTIDLANPASPTVRGELHMPGFMFYLEPHGNRVIGLGVDRTDAVGSLNVSLFDVSNLDSPQLLKRVPFGTPGVSEDYAILNYELPEDQDRIQKAFRVFPDGIVAVPFSAASSGYGSNSDACYGLQGGIQLVNWASDTLTPRAMLPMRGNPRRAFENNGEMVGVSDSNVTAFSLASTATTTLQDADLVIGSCDPKTMPDQIYYGGYDYYEGGYHHSFFGCSMGGPGSAAPAGTWVGGLLALLGLAGIPRRRRSA